MTDTGIRPARRRRRWPWVLGISIVLIGGLLVAAEAAARSIVPGIVRAGVLTAARLPASQELDVEVPGLLVPQLISGRLSEVRLSSDAVTVDGVTGAVDATVADVPLGDGPLGAVNGSLTIGQDSFAQLLNGAAIPVTGVALQAPNATVRGEVSVLGRAIPIGLTVTPGIQDGDVLLTPVSASLAGAQVDLQRLASMLGGLGQTLAAPQRLCIADRLPKGVTLTGLRIEGPRAVVDFSADGRLTVDAALRAKGTCSR